MCDSKIKQSNSKKRDSNIELLRILAMIMIVAHHFSVHGNFQSDSVSFVNNIWLKILFSGGKIGVDIFILISGYYLINSKEIKIKKVLMLLLQMLFYSILIFSLFVGFGLESFSVRLLFLNFLSYPIWWFAKCYLALYLIHPYINIVLNSLDKKNYQKLIIISTIIWCIIPTLTNESLDNGALIWFIYVYSLGGYLSKYPLKNYWTVKKCFTISIILYLITFSLSFGLDFISSKFDFFTRYAETFFEMDKLLILLITLFLFISFTKIEIKYNKFINLISSTTFGIYLIHDGEYAIRPFLWQTLFKNANYSDRLLLIPYSIIVIIIVFVTCSIIELLRIYLLEKKYLKIVDKVSNYFNKIFKKFLNLNFLNKI